MGAMPYSRYFFGSLPWYSVTMITGIIVAFLLGQREEKRLSLPKDTMIDVTLLSVPLGIIGARLYYVLLSLDQFRSNPISVLYIWEGGIAIYGAVIGGLLGVVFYAKHKKLSLMRILDMVAPGLILAQAIGRWGNYFNQEAYGPLVENPALQFFPLSVLIAQGESASWHMATFFYESLWNVVVFLLLWFCFRKRSKRSGDVFLWYMVLYGGGRFWIEGLRTDSLMMGSLRFSQVLSVCMMLGVGLAFMLRAERKALPESALLLVLSAARLCIRPFFPYGIFLLAALYVVLLFRLERKRIWLGVALCAIDLSALTLLGLYGQRTVIDLIMPYLGLTTPILIYAQYNRLTLAESEAVQCP